MAVTVIEDGDSNQAGLKRLRQLFKDLSCLPMPVVLFVNRPRCIQWNPGWVLRPPCKQECVQRFNRLSTLARHRVLTLDPALCQQDACQQNAQKGGCRQHLNQRQAQPLALTLG